jgi:ankyrin repeat protein
MTNLVILVITPSSRAYYRGQPSLACSELRLGKLLLRHLPAFALLTTIGLAAAGDDGLRLVRAAVRQDLPTVRVLLESAAPGPKGPGLRTTAVPGPKGPGLRTVDVNERQADGTTAIIWAAHWDHLEMARLLVARGANVNLATDLGVTALSLACTNGSVAMVDLLLRAGANANAARSTGETPLMTCARTGRTAAVAALLARGAEVNARQARGQTALMWAIAERHVEIVQTLIGRGADVNARSAGGFTPLMFAAQQSSLEAAQALLAAGARIDDRAPDGSSPLLLSLSGTHPVGAANVTLDRSDGLPLLLLSKGANPNLADADGYTPLHWAAERGRLALVKALLAAGANPNARVSKDPPPPSGSFTFSTKGLAQATPFWLATRERHIDVLRALAAGGADVSMAGDGGVSPLMLAMPGGRGQAAARNGGDIVTVLLELGADVNAANAAGQTPLHAAAAAGANDIVQALVDKGAKLDAQDKRGDTPLTVAERRADKSTAALIRTLLSR